MNENLKQSVDLFFENIETVNKKFVWDDTEMRLLCAMGYSAKGMAVDVDRMKEATELLKKKANIFSNFRGNIELMMKLQMAQSDDMEAYFDHVKAVYEKLLQGKWFAVEPDHYIVAAMVIAENDGSSAADDEYVQKTLSLYSRMKKNHPWLTGDEDLGYAALLAVSDLEEDAVVAEMECCYQRLKEEKRFPSANGIQSLSHVLSLEVGNSAEKSEKVIAIYDGLKERNKKYGYEYELSTLGGLAFTDADSQVLVSEISEVDDYLKTNKHFEGLFGVSSKQRLMYAAIFVMRHHDSKITGVRMAAMSGVVSMIVAEQAAMMAIIASSTVISTMHR